MRFPLIRAGDDDTPWAWWEWLLAPIIWPVLLILMVVVAAVSIPVEIVYRFRMWRQEKKLLARLTSVGRSVPWSEIEARFRAGEGTLIVEHRSPNGPIREWWSEDDLVGEAPLPLPTSVRSLPPEGPCESVREYARFCAARYAAPDSGTAKLTALPVPLNWKLDPRRRVVVDLGGGSMTTVILPVPTPRGLAAKYPHGKVVTLIVWGDNPILAAGDAETVFLTNA